MSINNIIQLSPSSVPPSGLNLLCDGLRCQNTVKCNSLLATGESTFFSNVSCFGELAHFYNDVQIDGSLNSGSVNFDNIICQTITGATGSFSAGVTGASLHGTAVTGGNASFTGAGVFGSVVASNATLSAATVTNNLNVGQTGTFKNLVVSQNQNITGFINCGATGSFNSVVTNDNLINNKNIIPRLTTAAGSADDGNLFLNTDWQYCQCYNNGRFNTISYFSQVASYFLNSDESAPNGALFKIGSVANMKEIYNSNANEKFEYLDFGEWKISEGIYKLNLNIALQPPASDFNNLQIYIYFGLSDGSNMLNCWGFTDSTGLYHFPNKEQKYLFECTEFLTTGTYSFFIYQQNDTANNFNIINSSFSPFAPSHNNTFTIQFISPKL